jgi:hypothetical protein
MRKQRVGRRAAGTASLVTAAALLLLLSRSEIRRTLLAEPAVLPALAALLWMSTFLIFRLGGR